MPSLSARTRMLAGATLAVASLAGPLGAVPGRTVGNYTLLPKWDDRPARGTSADGRYIVYTAAAGTTPSTRIYPLTYVFDTVTKRSEVVSVSSSGVRGGPAGETAKDEWATGSISGDGRYVVFVSGAPKLVPRDGNASKDVFLRDRVARTTIRVNVDVKGVEMAAGQKGGGDQPFHAAISRDGTRVLFHTEYDLLRDGGTGDTWYQYNRITRRLVAVDRKPGTRQGSAAMLWGGPDINDNVEGDPGPHNQAIGPNGQSAMSANGRYVVFSTTAQLVAADTDTDPDVYRRDTVAGTTTLVTDASLDATAPAATPGAGTSAPGAAVPAIPGVTTDEFQVYPGSPIVLPDTAEYTWGSTDSSGQRIAFLATYRRTRTWNVTYYADEQVDARVVVKDVQSGAVTTVRQVTEIIRHSVIQSPEPAIYMPVLAGNGSAVLYVVSQRAAYVIRGGGTSVDPDATLYRTSVPALTTVAVSSPACTVAGPSGCAYRHSATTPVECPTELPDLPVDCPAVKGLQENNTILAYVASYTGGAVVFQTPVPMVDGDIDGKGDNYLWRG